jgi:hypothetical protein
VALHPGLSRGNRWRATIAALGILLAGCGSSGSVPALNTGPLGGGGEAGELCNPVYRGESLTNGFTALSNSSTSPVVIERVALARPRQLRLLAAYIVPITGHYLLGDWAGFPPPAGKLDPGVQWAQRRPAGGARIAPGQPHEVVNLVVILKPESAIGSASGIDVYYTAAGTRYHLRTATGLRVVVAPEHC